MLQAFFTNYGELWYSFVKLKLYLTYFDRRESECFVRKKHSSVGLHQTLAPCAMLADSAVIVCFEGRSRIRDVECNNGTAAAIYFPTVDLSSLSQVTTVGEFFVSISGKRKTVPSSTRYLSISAAWTIKSGCAGFIGGMRNAAAPSVFRAP